VKPHADLLDELRRIDGRGYKAYKAIRGSYRGEGFDLHVEHVQGDPFAAPSRLRVVVPGADGGLPEWARRDATRRAAAADFLNRALADVLAGLSRKRGSGKSGAMRVVRPGQQVLPRTSLEVAPDGAITARFTVGLPAQGRRVLGRQAAALLGDALLDALDDALCFEALDADALRRHVEAVEDARALRAQLAERGLVAFVADGAVLPRRSGADDRPLDAGAVPFASPPGLQVTLAAPNAGEVAGMGIPRGVTLITGGGFHGKSTLLRAIERGVYDHAPGDGRERVVTVPDAVKVRAEDGRAIAGCDIGNFIAGLPGGQDTRAFTTPNASGSTSQAAAIVEALEVGAGCLLMDEDTSATNFMIRDARMQALVAAEDEPITPFIDRARRLADAEGVSTVLVVGGSGDYFDVADTVVAMQAYRPREVTAEARAVAERYPTRRTTGGGSWQPLRPRIPRPGSLDPRRGRKEVAIKTPSDVRLLYGEDEVDVAAVEQLVDVGQLRAAAWAVAWALRSGVIDGRRTLPEALGRVRDAVAADGLAILQDRPGGDLAWFRVFELAAVLGRIRSLEVDG